jgi:tetratricopeptide (TPR) repeat protein
MSRRERRAASKRAKADLKSLALTVEPALCEAVLGHARSGRYLDAQLCCHRALEARPEHPELLHLMALVHFTAKQFDHAVEWASRAIRKDPKPAYLTTLGTALLNLRRHDDALKVFDKAVQLKPDDPELWSNFGEALVEAGRLADAVTCFGRALQIDPRRWDTAYNSGMLLRQLGRLDEALVCFDACERLRPGQAATLHLRALVLDALGRFEESLCDNRRANELDRGNPYICNCLGHNLMHLGRDDEALPWFDRALRVQPAFVEALNNKAFSLAQLHRFDEAFAVYAKSKAIDANNAGTDWNLARLQMLTGNFEDGWAGREARWRLPKLALDYPTSWGPMWLGEHSVTGKTLVVRQDEGLGDAIQFARYVPMLASRGARVILVVDPPLCPLLSRLRGVSQCLQKLPSSVVPPFDFHIAIDSLPLAFATTLDSIPAEEAYLPPPEANRVQAWEDRLGRHERLRVGLVWSGNPKHINDRNRSMPLQVMSPLLDVDAMFVSLQRDPRPRDADVLRERTEIIDHSRDLTDFVETAALVSCLDLVIAVDTSVAHLAAALGRPTWILLPHTPDYRWLLGREDSPWYPTVRLFRQTKTRDYASVVERVRTELTAWVAAARPAVLP